MVLIKKKGTAALFIDIEKRIILLGAKAFYIK